MRSPQVRLFAVAMFFGCLIHTAVRAQEAAPSQAGPAPQGPTEPIQIALFNPAQIVNEKASIEGVRLNVLYGVNQDMRGLDVGLVNQVNGNAGAFQYGLVGNVKGNFQGWQDNAVNITNGQFAGLASGLYNQAGDATGVQ